MDDLFRASHIELIKSIEPNCLLTLGLGLGCAPSTFRRDANGYFNWVQRQALGARWLKAPADQRLAAVGYLEKLETNPHAHLAVRATQRLRNILAVSGTQWKRFRRGGDHHFDGPLESVDLYARYITKNLWADRDHENVYCYTPNI